MADRTCAIPDCGRSKYVRGWCVMHYQRWRAHGDPLYVRPPGWKRKSPPPTPKRFCTECGAPMLAKGLCGPHYRAKYWIDQRDAHRERHRKWRQAHLDERRAAIKAWHRAHPEAKRQSEARRREAKRSGRSTTQISAELLAAKVAYWGHACWVCGGPWAEYDHVKPLAKGGTHLLANIRPICSPCNKAKKDRWPLTEVRRPDEPAIP